MQSSVSCVPLWVLDRCLLSPSHSFGHGQALCHSSGHVVPSLQALAACSGDRHKVHAHGATILTCTWERSLKTGFIMMESPSFRSPETCFQSTPKAGLMTTWQRCSKGTHTLMGVSLPPLRPARSSIFPSHSPLCLTQPHQLLTSVPP